MPQPFTFSKCLRLAVPRQELEEIDINNDMFSDPTVGTIQQLQGIGVYEYIEADRVKHNTNNYIHLSKMWISIKIWKLDLYKQVQQIYT